MEATIARNSLQELQVPAQATPLEEASVGLRENTLASPADISFEGLTFVPKLPPSIRSKIEMIRLEGQQPQLNDNPRFNVVITFQADGSPQRTVRFDHLPADLKTAKDSKETSFAA